jgi:hypothetical protein
MTCETAAIDSDLLAASPNAVQADANYTKVRTTTHLVAVLRKRFRLAALGTVKPIQAYFPLVPTTHISYYVTQKGLRLVLLFIRISHFTFGPRCCYSILNKTNCLLYISASVVTTLKCTCVATCTTFYSITTPARHHKGVFIQRLPFKKDRNDNKFTTRAEGYYVHISYSSSVSRV